MSFQTIDITGIEREQWLEMRRAYIGGSDAGTIVGANPWRSAYELALDKLDALPSTERETSEAAYWGTMHEQTILSHVLALDGFEFAMAVDTKNQMYISDTYPWALANLDGLLLDRKRNGTLVGLEVKTASEYKRDEWESGTLGEDGRAPTSYVLQCQHYMAVRDDIDHFIIAALVGGNKFFLVTVPRDDDVIRELMRLERGFVEMVKAGRVPDPTGSDRDREILNALNPEPEGDVDLDADMVEIAEQYAAAQADERDSKARKKTAGALLLQALGSAKKGRAGSFVVNRIIKDTPEHTVKASHSDYITVKEVRA